MTSVMRGGVIYSNDYINDIVERFKLPQIWIDSIIEGSIMKIDYSCLSTEQEKKIALLYKMGHALIVIPGQINQIYLGIFNKIPFNDSRFKDAMVYFIEETDEGR
jgi:hypothetical protein